ncbi:amino acid transporter transmembrane protein [Streptomyces laurentii]|uniref:Amino acid transporter transmembrane protein n=1 Tax=Streptomyces laurentii TaxID=39478 RepID=A0A161JHD6_STRLU|nr:amino acid transporter transmembrane protein [Streptomyces laurentii]
MRTTSGRGPGRGPAKGPGRGLQPNALGTFDTILMAVAGSAPAYSLAATTAVLFGTAGFAGPAALLYCAIPMLGIVLAYARLGRIDVNAGAAYSWVGRTLHPFLGFLSGWALVFAATVFMVAGSLPAGSLTLSLVDPALADDTLLASAVGAGWFLVMLLIVLGGARLTVRAQLLMSGIEMAILLVFILGVLAHHGYATAFDWSWFGFGHFGGASGFASSALIAAFYYWGWDVTSNLSEETRDSRRTAGFAALVGTGVVFLLFVAFTVAVNVLLSADKIETSGTNVLAVLGEEIWPGVGGKLLILAVLLSTVATLETTLLQATRSLFAMGRDHTLPSALGVVHRRWNTPWVAIVAVGVVALGLFAAATAAGSVTEALQTGVSAIGLQISLYYALAGIAAVVAYRKLVLTSVREFFLGAAWPLLGSAFMLWVFFQSLGELSGAALTVGLGGLAAGVPLMLVYWRKGSSYYRPARLCAVSALAAAEPFDSSDSPRARREEKSLATDF